MTVAGIMIYIQWNSSLEGYKYEEELSNQTKQYLCTVDSRVSMLQLLMALCQMRMPGARTTSKHEE